MLAALLLVIFALDGPSKAESGQAYLNDKPYFTDVGQFNYAAFLMREGDFQLAAREFARLIESFPASPLIPH